MLKRYILTGIRDGPHEPFIADSVDFVVGQVNFMLVILRFLLLSLHHEINKYACIFLGRDIIKGWSIFKIIVEC